MSYVVIADTVTEVRWGDLFLSKNPGSKQVSLSFSQEDLQSTFGALPYIGKSPRNNLDMFLLLPQHNNPMNLEEAIAEQKELHEIANKYGYGVHVPVKDELAVVGQSKAKGLIYSEGRDGYYVSSSLDRHLSVIFTNLVTGRNSPEAPKLRGTVCYILQLDVRNPK